MTDKPADIGHNKPPSDLDILRERLNLEQSDLKDRKTELLASCGRLPEQCTTEEMAGKFADLSKQIATCIIRTKSAYSMEKEPHDVLLAACRGFFAGIKDPLDDARKILTERLKAYQTELERIKRERAEKAASDARIAAAKAKKEAADQLARAAKIEADALAKAQAEEASEAETEAALNKAIKADREATDAANVAAAKQEAAKVKSADLTRARGELGSVTSLSEHWTFEIENLKIVDLETLRPHIPVDAIYQAIRAHIKVGGRAGSLKGVRIYKDHKSVVR